ncbi:MAG: TIGR00730 family Rossman fold protein, partial [Oscillospiraceae bacterium]|nr:TIGR00730 family Rossman fold protein [Oscillospiraceae bacterium]
MDICVYLSAQDGKSEAYKETVRRFGRFIAENGHRLVYGGSKSGLMGEIAISALEAGGEVIGVEPEFFIEAEFQLEG